MEKGSNHSKCSFYGDLYHVDVYMPPYLQKKAFDMFKHFQERIILPGHIMENLNCDKCHTYSVPEVVDAIKRVSDEDVNLFEIGTAYSDNPLRFNSKILKFAVRVPYDEVSDVVVVFSCNGRIKTAWINDRSDNHHTLNRNKYVQRPIKRK